MILRQNRSLLQLFVAFLLALQAFTNTATHAAPQLTFLPDVEENLGKGMLWKVTNSETGKRSYLFGTIHVDDPEILRLALPVRRAIIESKSLTLELLPNQDTMLQSAFAMMFNDGRTLETVAGKKLYQRSVKAMKSKGMSADVVGQMKPWAVMMTLSVPESKTGKFLDFYLYEQATKYSKKTHALESYAEQLAVFNDMAMDEQVKMLRDTLDTLPELPGYFRSLKKAWLKRDLSKLQELSNKHMPSDDPANQKLMQRLLDDRNHKMFERMQPRLKEGRAFIAVGALHLPGKEGLIKLLRQDGYKVEAVW